MQVVLSCGKLPKRQSAAHKVPSSFVARSATAGKATAATLQHVQAGQATLYENKVTGKGGQVEVSEVRGSSVHVKTKIENNIIFGAGWSKSGRCVFHSHLSTLIHEDLCVCSPVRFGTSVIRGFLLLHLHVFQALHCSCLTLLIRAQHTGGDYCCGAGPRSP